MGAFYTNHDMSKNDILIRYVDANGERRKTTIVNGEWKPTLYVDARQGSTPDARTIHGEPLSKMVLDSVSHARDKLRELSDVGVKAHGYGKWANMWVAEQYSAEEISSSWDFEKVSTVFLDIETEVEHGFPDSNDPLERVNMITLHDVLSGDTLVLTLEHSWAYDPEGPLGDIVEKTGIDPGKIVNEAFDDELKMLSRMYVWFREKDPDAYTGWNLEGFDIPYLVARTRRLAPGDRGDRLVAKLSPWGIVRDKKTRTQWGKETTVHVVVGAEVLDMMLLYKKFVLAPRENYKLDHIVWVDLKERKMKHESGIPGHMLYRDHFDDGVSYNVKDVFLLVALEQKKNILRSALTIAYTSLVNWSEVLSQIRMWDNLIYVDLAEQGVQIPVDKDSKRGSEYPGAYVKPPRPGRYDWVVSFDVTSMYPNILRALNISPEKICEHDSYLVAVGSKDAQSNIAEKYYDREVDLSDATDRMICVGANGHCFAADSVGFLPKIVRRLFDERSSCKRKMIECLKAAEATDDPKEKRALKDEAGRWDLLQNSKKVQLNSLYGAMGNEYFRYFDVRMATAITLTGQVLIKWVARDINDYVSKMLGDPETVDRVITIDTDGIYVDFSDVVDKAMGDWDRDRVADALVRFADEKMQRVINDSLEELGKYLNCFEPEALSMKREAVADAAVFIAKKRYFLNLLDDEGVRFTPDSRGVGKLKFMGVEAKKSSTPEILRKWMEECFPIFLFGKEADFQTDVTARRAQHAALPVEAVAFNSGVNHLAKYATPDGRPAKGAPQNTKAALSHNHLIGKSGLEERYPLIKEGDNIKYVILKTPNPAGSDLLGWGDDFPFETGAGDHVDHGAMFEKTFVSPMQGIADAVGWDAVFRPKLEDEF